jgi:hypothetical protein
MWKPLWVSAILYPSLNVCNICQKFVQAWDVFNCDFVDAVKACERNIYKLYVDPITSYGHADGIFQTFLVIVHYSYDPLHMVWIF